MSHRMITGGCVSQAIFIQRSRAYLSWPSLSVQRLSQISVIIHLAQMIERLEVTTTTLPHLHALKSEAFRTSKRSSHKLGHRAKGQIIWKPTLLPRMDFAGNEKCKIFFQVLAENYYTR